MGSKQIIYIRGGDVRIADLVSERVWKPPRHERDDCVQEASIPQAVCMPIWLLSV